MLLRLVRVHVCIINIIVVITYVCSCSINNYYIGHLLSLRLYSLSQLKLLISNQ